MAHREPLLLDELAYVKYGTLDPALDPASDEYRDAARRVGWHIVQAQNDNGSWQTWCGQTVPPGARTRTEPPPSADPRGDETRTSCDECFDELAQHVQSWHV